MLVQSPSKRQDDKVTVRKPSVDRMEWRAQGRWGLVSEKSKKKVKRKQSRPKAEAKHPLWFHNRLLTPTTDMASALACQHTRLLAAASTTQMRTGSNAADLQVYNENAVHLPPPLFFFTDLHFYVPPTDCGVPVSYWASSCDGFDLICISNYDWRN